MSLVTSMAATSLQEEAISRVNPGLGRPAWSSLSYTLTGCQARRTAPFRIESAFNIL